MPASTFAQSGSRERSRRSDVYVNAISAALAGCIAEAVTIPLDTAKVRLQIQGEKARPDGAATSHLKTTKDALRSQVKYRGMLHTLKDITKEEGFRALYNGLSPGIQRQLAFSPIRLGLYDVVKQKYIELFSVQGLVSDNNIGLRLLAGITTGAFAVCIAQPTDVVKVRLQAQTKGNKRYYGTLHAYKTIGKEEGVRGLWKGVLPNITRNAIVNGVELATYDVIKEALLKRGILSDNIPCYLVSAFGAGFCANVVASPVDVVKTRFMNSAKGTYRGIFSCVAAMVNEGGIRVFYKGFVPSYMRVGSWSVVMFLSYEQLKRLFTKSSATYSSNKENHTSNVKS